MYPCIYGRFRLQVMHKTGGQRFQACEMYIVLKNYPSLNGRRE